MFNYIGYQYPFSVNISFLFFIVIICTIFLTGRLNMLFQVAVVLGIILSYAFGPLVKYCPQKPLKALFNVSCCLWAAIHAIVLYSMAVREPYVVIIVDDDDEIQPLMDEGYVNIHETLIEIFKQIV